jgi:hypothetical protein
VARLNVTFRFDSALYRQFRKVSKERGHTMTWYLEGCMREVIGEKRREVIPAIQLVDLKGKKVKPLAELTKPKRKKKS